MSRLFSNGSIASFYYNGTTNTVDSCAAFRPLRNSPRLIRLENLQRKWAPSETTRRHRKDVRVTDLARPSIYVLFFEDEVVYVGQSMNPYARMAQHLRDKRFTHIRVMACRKERMKHWEAKLIKAYQPRHNIAHKY